MKPMIAEACKTCGGEDCVCCEIYAEQVRPAQSYEDLFGEEDPFDIMAGITRGVDYDRYEEDEDE
jgi:hypothetical protein